MSATCQQCGSDKIIPDAIIFDQGEMSSGRLQVMLHGDPQAWIFKNTQLGELRGRVCGACGFVELRVLNPDELYRHYLRTNKPAQD